MATQSSSSSTGSLSSMASSMSHKKPKLKLPIASIPDMRFEQSYLASVRGFVHEYTSTMADEIKMEQISEDRGEELGEKSTNVLRTRSPTGEPELWLGRLRIQWWPLLHLTIRDQLLSPVVQGALFGIGGLALSQLRAYLVSKR